MDTDYEVVENAEKIKSNEMAQHIRVNGAETLIDMEDDLNDHIGLLRLTYADNNQVRGLMNNNREYYFEMDTRLSSHFFKLLSEGQEAKSMFTNLKSFFCHKKHYIRAISIDNFQTRTAICHLNYYWTVRINRESTFFAEGCNGNTIVYSLPDPKRIEKMYHKILLDDGNMTKRTVTMYSAKMAPDEDI